VSGADGDQVPPRLREKTIIQRTGQLMYELSTLYPDISGLQPQYGWAADYARSGDGLPCIGPHRNYPHHLFAFGDSSHSVTGAYLASRILLRHHFGEMDPADEFYGFHR
jgi:glycine/D-amino acid oxidase-like deaminating enzyme